METTSSLIEEQMRTVVVGVADFKISTDPLTYLVTYALGSCLGVTFYDEKRRIGGLLQAKKSERRCSSIPALRKSSPR
jgi:chemotaxis protein CheD